ncbi:MAG: MBL fold metallo-hydrolase [Opitutaceae bacterium]|nr:MBL fold metallo-hydrolase [Opitutaceae bacterium]
MTLPLSDHFNGKSFFQRHHERALRRRDFWRWQLTTRRKPWPTRVPFVEQPAPPRPRENEMIVTWIGHASFLIQTAHGNILIDPVFSPRVSPFSWFGPKRVHPPGVAFEALPPIHVVLLSHDHYDHCDIPTLRRVAAKHDPLFIAPLRHGDLLAAAGARRVIELDWWQTHRPFDGLELTLTPTKHWSNRLGRPRNYRLWGGFFLTMNSPPAAPESSSGDTTRQRPATAPVPPRLWFAGDTGYDAEIFRAIRQRCGAPQLALLPIGAYEPRWFMAPMHINPAEAVQVHQDIDADVSVAMHWGTFRLTDESRDDPLVDLEEARLVAGITTTQFRVIAPGESLVLPRKDGPTEHRPRSGSNIMST